MKLKNYQEFLNEGKTFKISKTILNKKLIFGEGKYTYLARTKKDEGYPGSSGMGGDQKFVFKSNETDSKKLMEILKKHIE